MSISAVDSGIPQTLRRPDGGLCPRTSLQLDRRMSRLDILTFRSSYQIEWIIFGEPNTCLPRIYLML